MGTYTVTFDRIGRNHGVAPLEVVLTESQRLTPADELAERVHRYARKFLTSREVEVSVDLDTLEGVIVVGGFRPAGTFTVKAEQ